MISHLCSAFHCMSLIVWLPFCLVVWLCHFVLSLMASKHKKQSGKYFPDKLPLIPQFSMVMFIPRTKMREQRNINNEIYLHSFSPDNELHWFQMMMPRSGWSMNEIKHSHPTVNRSFCQATRKLCKECVCYSERNKNVASRAMTRMRISGLSNLERCLKQRWEMKL